MFPLPRWTTAQNVALGGGKMHWSPAPSGLNIAWESSLCSELALAETVCRSLRFQPWEVNGLGRAYEKEATGSSRVWDALELLKTYFFDPNLHLYTLWAVHPATESSGKWADAANIQNGVLLAATRASWSWEVLWGLIRQHCIHQGGQALAGSAVTKGNGQLTIHLLVGISKLIFANLRILYCMDLWSHSASQIS